MAFVTLFVFVAWMYQVWLLISLLLGPHASFSTLQEFMTVVLTTKEGLLFLAIGNAVGALLSLILFSLTVVSFPLLLEREVDFVTAMVTSVRAVTPTTLLFIIDSFSIAGQVDQSHNGLWKMQTNGTGLTRLTTDVPGISSGFNSATQFPWSNVSRDNSMYALQANGSHKETLEIGSLSGGTPTTIASISGKGASLSIVGWTKM